MNKNGLSNFSEKQLFEFLAITKIGTWTRNLQTDEVVFDAAWAELTGYRLDELTNTVLTWESGIFQDDLAQARDAIKKHILGETQVYQAEFRVRHKDGRILHMYERGKVIECDKNSNPLYLIAVVQDISGTSGQKVDTASFPVSNHVKDVRSKKTVEYLNCTLKEIEHYKDYLELEVVSLTKTIQDQDKMLWTVNSIAKKLLSFESKESFKNQVAACLQILGELTDKNRVFIWKDFFCENEIRHCTQEYEWVQRTRSVQDDPCLQNIAYDQLPSFHDFMERGVCLNSLVRDLSESERRLLEPQYIKAILIAPVIINGKRWGFLGIDNCESEQLFSDLEEKTLLLSGFLIASAIQKNESEAVIRETEEKSQIMLNAMPLCCQLWNSNFKNIACNDAAVRLFGLSSQTEYMDRFFEFSPEFQPDGSRSDELIIEKLKMVINEGSCRFEWLHKKLDGELIPAEITLVHVQSTGDYIIAGYTRDLREQKAMLTEIFKTEVELRAAHEEAKLSSQAKTNFLANMSHEIRTPMNAISGLAEIILRESRGRAAAEYAIAIKHACNSLLSIINDILDISKIESGKLEVVEASYQLSSLLNDVINIARLRLEGKQVIFLTNIDCNLPNYLYGDEIRIKQILINLLSNAIKFTQKGHISLSVSGIVDASQLKLCFEVTDTGCGIKQEDLHRLFVEFEQVNTKKNRSIEGTGLGLAISKRLCELMGGSISVTSEFTKGSVFSVTISQNIHKKEPIAYVEQKKKVLVYESRELYQKSIIETVKNLGCFCSSCKNQSELYEKIAGKQYEYIFTSAILIDKVKAILEKEQSNTKIIMLSNMGELVSEKDIPTVYFPVHCMQIAAILNDRVMAGAGYGQEKKIRYFSAPEARILVVDDNQVNLKVAIGLMEPYRFIMETAENGLEALKKIKNNVYDLIFMDHMMPEMDGIDATNAIRALEGDYFKKLPIIALTANALVGTKEMFLNEGMNDFLAKPIELTKLHSILLKWLPKRLQQHRPETEKKNEVKPAFQIEGINTVQGLASVGGDIKNYLQILSVYYEDGLKKCDSLMQHFMRRDNNAFRIEAHSLKSASASIGALDLSLWAQKLEAAAADSNTEYIDENIDFFIYELKNLLEKIKPYTISEIPQTTPDMPKAENGERALLTAKLSILSNSLEFANITEIENILNQLRLYTWSPQIATKLDKIKKCVAIFDYDEAQRFVQTIQLSK